jgi:hypothetical protein
MVQYPANMRGQRMTESTGSAQPPEWYTKPPAWLTDPPARQGRYRDDDDRDNDRGRYRRGSRDDDDLATAIRAMPEQVVSALREAIQGAQQSQQQNNGGQASNSGQQEQNSGGQQQQSDPPKDDDKPREQLSWGERWMANML